MALFKYRKQGDGSGRPQYNSVSVNDSIDRSI